MAVSGKSRGWRTHVLPEGMNKTFDRQQIQSFLHPPFQICVTLIVPIMLGMSKLASPEVMLVRQYRLSSLFYVCSLCRWIWSTCTRSLATMLSPWASTSQSSTSASSETFSLHISIHYPQAEYKIWNHCQSSTSLSKRFSLVLNLVPNQVGYPGRAGHQECWAVQPWDGWKQTKVWGASDPAISAWKFYVRICVCS